MTVQERFESKYIKDPSGCWLWQACVNNKGYGGFCLDGKWAMAHRVSWETVNGKIENSLCVLHKCDIPRCINPDHLFLGSRSDNMKDAVKKKRQNHSKQLKCKYGHTLKGNSYVRNDCAGVGRRCKICHCKRQKKYKAKRKANG